MTQYRTDGRDSAAPQIKPKRPPKVGATPPNKVRVLDHLGRHVATVGKLATAATASRFLNGRGAKLTRVNGRQCWKGDKPE